MSQKLSPFEKNGKETHGGVPVHIQVYGYTSKGDQSDMELFQSFCKGGYP